MMFLSEREASHLPMEHAVRLGVAKRVAGGWEVGNLETLHKMHEQALEHWESVSGMKGPDVR